MANVFENLASSMRNSKIVIWVWLASMAMFVVGANHFREDLQSSYTGIRMLEEAFGMNPVSWDFTYWTMSLAPQVAQIVFTYLFMSNTKKNRWAIFVAMLALWVDFFADTWYRSNGLIGTDLGASIVSIILTLAFFTIGSELFLTVSFGILLELAAPTWTQFANSVGELKDAMSGGKKATHTPKGKFSRYDMELPEFLREREQVR